MTLLNPTEEQIVGWQSEQSDVGRGGCNAGENVSEGRGGEKMGVGGAIMGYTCPLQGQGFGVGGVYKRKMWTKWTECVIKADKLKDRWRGRGRPHNSEWACWSKKTGTLWSSYNNAPQAWLHLKCHHQREMNDWRPDTEINGRILPGPLKKT